MKPWSKGHVNSEWVALEIKEGVELEFHWEAIVGLLEEHAALVVLWGGLVEDLFFAIAMEKFPKVGLNHRPDPYKESALPTELFGKGIRERNRTSTQRMSH